MKYSIGDATVLLESYNGEMKIKMLIDELSNAGGFNISIKDFSSRMQETEF